MYLHISMYLSITFLSIYRQDYLVLRLHTKLHPMLLAHSQVQSNLGTFFIQVLIREHAKGVKAYQKTNLIPSKNIKLGQH